MQYDEVFFNEVQWAENILTYRVEACRDLTPLENFENIPGLDEQSPYSDFIQQGGYSFHERAAIAFLSAIMLQPAVNTCLVQAMKDPERRSFIGGYIHEQSLRFSPSYRTLLFFLLGGKTEAYTSLFRQLGPRSRLFAEGIALVKDQLMDTALPLIDRRIEIDEQHLFYFSGGDAPRLDGSDGFPAELGKTGLSFNDIVLVEETKRQLEDLVKYVRNRKKLLHLAGNDGRIKTNYVTVFTGEPGTGKTVTAKTIGKQFGFPVYVINLSRVISKYIGETEKNLEKVFLRLSGKDCILFFDEADALFGKRIEVKEARDRYANQEVTFLLQKIEEFNAIAILATNIKDISTAFDKAFQRRIRRVIKFEFPSMFEREILWQSFLPKGFIMNKQLTERLSRDYQLTGASINNIVSDSIIEALDRNVNELEFDLIEPFLKIEFLKTERPYKICTDEMVSANPEMRLGRNVLRGNF